MHLHALPGQSVAIKAKQIRFLVSHQVMASQTSANIYPVNVTLNMMYMHIVVLPLACSTDGDLAQRHTGPIRAVCTSCG